MVRVENLTVEGKAFFPLSSEPEELKGFKGAVTEFMRKKGYNPADPKVSIFQDRFLAMEFYRRQTPVDIPLSLKVKKTFGIVDEEKLHREQNFRALKSTRNDIPYEITFLITRGSLKDTEGYIVTIQSKPAAIFKCQQLKMKPEFSEFELSSIVEENRKIVKEIISGLAGNVIEEPNPKSEIIKTSIVDKLERFEFEKTAQLLRNGRAKVERGDIEDGLTDLRSALEEFARELLNKTEGSNKRNLKENFKILEGKEEFNERILRFTKDVVYKFLFRYLSNKPVHGREKLRLPDAKFLFDVAEKSMDYLLDRVLRRT